MKQLKIVLVEVANQNFFSKIQPSIARTGLPGLAAILKSKGYLVKVFAEQFGKIDLKEISEAAFLGISTLTSNFNRGLRIAKMAKEKNSNIHIAMGGPHVSVVSETEYALKTGWVDYVAHHDGETVILPLIEAVQNGSGFEKIHNLSWKAQGGEIIHNSIGPTFYDLDAYPAPDMESIQGFEKKMKAKFGPNPTISIEASRGCPHNCDFCCVWGHFGRRTRHRDPEIVVDYIKYLLKKGYNDFFFVDDNFAINSKITAQLLELLAKLEPLPHWSAQIEVGTDPELFPLMKEAGGGRMFVGAESLSNSSLQEYHKKQNTEERIRKCVENLHQAGLRSHLMLMAGAEHDTPEVIRKNIDFCIKKKVNTIWVSILTPYKGTPLYEKLEAENRIYDKNWDHYDAFHPVFSLRHFSPWGLAREVVRNTARFYILLRPFKSKFLEKKKEDFWGQLFGWLACKYFQIKYLVERTKGRFKIERG